MRALDRLSPRERVLVLGLLPLAVVALAWQLAFVPIQRGRAEARAEIAAWRQVAATARAAADRAADRTADRAGGAAVNAALPAAAPADAAPRAPLASRVTDSAEVASLDLRRLEPDGPRLRVTLSDAPFDRVIDWIAALEGGAQVVVVAAEIDRRPEPGTVTALLTLAEAP